MTTPTELVLSALPDHRRSGDGWAARCPAHDDRQASLSINTGDDGRVLIHDHAGCPTEAIVAAIGLKLADLMPSTNGHAATNGHASNGKPKGAKKTYATATDAIAALTSKRGQPSATWQYDDATGQHVGTICRWDAPEGKQILPVSRNGSGWHCAGMAEPRPLYKLPTLATADVVYVPEGEKAADAARSLGLPATTSAHGAKSPTKTDWTPLAGKSIVILPDNDQAGRDYAETVAGILAKLEPPARVKIVALPGLPEGGDIHDWICDLHGEAAEPDSMREEIEALVAAAEPWQPSAKKSKGKKGRGRPQPKVEYRPAGRVEIEITTEENTINEAVANALGNDPELYGRGGTLAMMGDDDGKPIIIPVPEAIVRDRIAAAIQFFRLLESPNGGCCKIPEHPPGWNVKALTAWRRWPHMRQLLGFVTVPTIRADGSLLDAAGYDPATKLIYVPCGCAPELSQSPTRADALAARDALLDVVCDFPFKADSHRASWLAYLLTLLARFAFKGPSPLFAFDGTVAGTGKSLLTDVSFVIAFGSEADRFTNPTNDDEARKRITSLALSGAPAVLIDNIGGIFGSPSLDAALTATSWGDRLLGKNQDVRIPLRVVWAATANNLILRPDTARRVAHIRLESKVEQPEQREGFKYPELIAHVTEHRAKLLGSGLTIMRAWFTAGKPKQSLAAWGSYEGWSAVIRQAVVWLDLPDPASTREEFRAVADRESTAFKELVIGLLDADPDGYGLQAAEIVELVEKEGNAHRQLKNALAELCAANTGKLSAKSVGRKLAHLRGRISDGFCIDCHTKRSNMKGWYVRKTETTE